MLSTFGKLMWDLGRLDSGLGRDFWVQRMSPLLADFGRLMVVAFQWTHTGEFMAVLSTGSFVLRAPKYTGPFSPPPTCSVIQQVHRAKERTQKAWRSPLVSMAEYLGLMLSHV